MKFQVLFLLCVFFFWSCQISQDARTNEPTGESNVGQQAVNSNEHVQSDVQTPVDESRFSSVKIKRTDQKQRFSLNVDVEYPQLRSPKTPQETKFNQYVKKLVDDQILDFTKFLIDKEKDVTDKSKHEYEINLSYKFDYYSDNFTSILMSWNGYSGWLNMDHFPSTVNFDFGKGNEVGLKDLFEPNSNFLEKLSELALARLQRTLFIVPLRKRHKCR